MRAATEPVAGSVPAGLGSARVGVRRDEAGALLDQANRAGDGLERVGARLAEHDVVGVAVGHDVADVVHGRRQAGLADDVGRSAGSLLGEELRRGQGGGPDRLLRHVDAAAEQPGAQVARREDRVVRQDEEASAGLLERRDELGGARDRVLLVHEDAVHVGEPRLDGPVIGHGPHCGGSGRRAAQDADWAMARSTRSAVRACWMTIVAAPMTPACTPVVAGTIWSTPVASGSERP